MLKFSKLKFSHNIGRKALSSLLSLTLLCGCVFNLAACKPKGGDSSADDEINTAQFINDYPATTTTGYYGEVTKQNITRKKPSVNSDKGPNAVVGTDYPLYGTNFSGDKNAMIAESNKLTATGTANAGGGGYTWMDKNGNLYAGTRSNPTKTNRQLYKHVAAQDNYHGNVSDTEPAVEKSVTLRPRGYDSYSVTGIYAPAGEVIAVTISEADMEATGGITVHIGQALYNGQANNIWEGKNMPRMPHLLNTMQVSKDTAEYDAKSKTYTAYVGSFIGGPLYIRNENVTFSATISGGVEYLHFILGYTTEEEYNRLKAKCSAPYFDMEVWNYGVLVSGPRIHAEKYTYDDIYQAAILWEKVTTVTTEVRKQGIVMLFDPFVAAGAAVAFPGRSSVNCPEGWMSGALDYNTMVTSGMWGNFHEYHHNFQGFGVGNGGEVTNNSLTLVSYSLFTKISSQRGINNFGAGSLGDWNRYTSATWALEETLKIKQHSGNPGNGNQGLALYATLLHNFGPDNFIKSTSGNNYQAYMNTWQEVTHNDLSYYFNDILGGNVNDTAPANYPTFVPVSCVYQTGRSYMYDGRKEYITTMQPYMIKDDEPFTVDLAKYTSDANGYCTGGSIILPDGFSYTVKNVSKPANGTIDWKAGSTSFTYTPAQKVKTSGKIVVTLAITKDGDTSFKVDDVDLVLEFEPTKNLNKNTLERTRYTFASGAGYTDAVEAYNANFAGATDTKKVDHSNPTQNANTDIWYYPNTDTYHTQHPNDPDYYFATNTPTVEVIDGKLYFESDGKYRVYLRGRSNCALYFSLDGKDYELGAKITQTLSSNSHMFRPTDENTYFDIIFDQGEVTVYPNGKAESKYSYKIGDSKDGAIANWLYIKEVLIAQQQGNVVPYIGVGVKKWDKLQYTITKAHYNERGKAVASETADGYEYTVSTYTLAGKTAVAEEHIKDHSKNKFQTGTSGNLTTVSEEEFNKFVTEPVVGGNIQPYANAYRRSYEFPDNSKFETDYFYKREYGYAYDENEHLGVGTQKVVENQCTNLSLSTGWGGNDLSVVVDGIKDQGGKMQLHTSRALNADSPFTLVVDLGKVCTANRLVIYSQGNRADPQFPKALNLYASTDGTNYNLVKSYTELTHSGNSQILDFNDTQMRYYKIEITQSTNTYIIIRELEMWRIFELGGGTQITPDSPDITYYGNWSIEQTPGTFGHVYAGKKGATMKFDFTGTRFGIFASPLYGNNFEVYIDGNKVNSLSLKKSGGTALVFLTDTLNNGSHHVEIKCTGDANIDSLAVYR